MATERRDPGLPPVYSQTSAASALKASLDKADRRLEVTRKSLLVYAFPALLLCTFVIGFDSSYFIGNYARRIAVELREFGHARWLVLGFLVTESALGPLYGHAAQVHGHTSTILVAAVLVCIGLLLCSLSHRLWQVALSRVVVGAGTAGIELLVVVIMNNLVQLYELPLWNSAAVFSGTIGLMLGGPMGAALMDRLGFRSTFGLECLGMVVAFVVLYLTLQLPHTKDRRSVHVAQRIEYPSTVLLLLSVAAPLFSLNLGGDVFPWTHPVVITLFCLTPVFAALFYFAETRIANIPLVPNRFMHNRHVVIVCICTLPMKFVYDQLRFSFGTYLEARSFGNESSSFNDWALTCIYLGRPFGTLLGGVVIRRSRRFKQPLQLNIVVDIAIYFCFAVGWIHPEKPVFAPLLVFMGGAEGFAESLWLVALLSLVDTEDQPLLYAFFNLAMAISGDLGIAISLAAEGFLVRYKLVAKLSDYDDADAIISKSLKDLNYIRQLPSKAQTVILDALTSSIEVAFGISCLVLAVSLVSSFYVKDMPRVSRAVSVSLVS